LSQRDVLMIEIAVGLRAKAPSPFIKKAGALLTRFWGGADWYAREEILKTARWLLNLARVHPSPLARTRGATKRKTRVRLHSGSGTRSRERAPILEAAAHVATD
jgi:hypothetical protein